MAFYILIEKVSENSSDAVYKFYDPAYPNEIGELKLNKVSQGIEMTVAVRESLFQRAAAKVARHYRAGELPEKMEWAS